MLQLRIGIGSISLTIPSEVPGGRHGNPPIQVTKSFRFWLPIYDTLTLNATLHHSWECGTTTCPSPMGFPKKLSNQSITRLDLFSR
jgi:hypothetical protein